MRLWLQKTAQADASAYAVKQAGWCKYMNSLLKDDVPTSFVRLVPSAFTYSRCCSSANNAVIARVSGHNWSSASLSKLAHLSFLSFVRECRCPDQPWPLPPHAATMLSMYLSPCPNKISFLPLSNKPSCLHRILLSIDVETLASYSERLHPN